MEGSTDIILRLEVGDSLVQQAGSMPTGIAGLHRGCHGPVEHLSRACRPLFRTNLTAKYASRTRRGEKVRDLGVQNYICRMVHGGDAGARLKELVSPGIIIVSRHQNVRDAGFISALPCL